MKEIIIHNELEVYRHEPRNSWFEKYCRREERLTKALDGITFSVEEGEYEQDTQRVRKFVYTVNIEKNSVQR